MNFLKTDKPVVLTKIILILQDFKKCISVRNIRSFIFKVKKKLDFWKYLKRKSISFFLEDLHLR